MPNEVMEIRHHTESSIQTLLNRARREVKVKEHLEMLERFHKYMRAQGYSLDTIYVYLNRECVFKMRSKSLRRSTRGTLYSFGRRRIGSEKV
ncbi:MAG: hypothetical protein DRZ82_08575 [Thermoprotei archaeon]|nr:MAG: hypothetical protein DRZ82_08575 [Thermoprotei archaeon]